MENILKLTNHIKIFAQTPDLGFCPDLGHQVFRQTMYLCMYLQQICGNSNHLLLHTVWVITMASHYIMYYPKVTPELHKVTTELPKVTQELPKVTPGVTLSDPKGTPELPKGTPELPKVIPELPKVTPELPKVT